MRGISTPNGLKGSELHRFIVSKLDSIVATKKMAMKYADAVSFGGALISKEGQVSKEAKPATVEAGIIKNSTVINTCFWYDSHGDVHIPGLWKKSLKDNSKRSENAILLLQEHQMKFDKIIADGSSVVPYTATMSWAQLGVDFKGDTEVLIFDNTIHKDRNEFMFGQYEKGWVKNHSVGMRYVDIELAINTGEKDMKAYKDRWDMYIDSIANKDEVEEEGIFWAITQAGVVEGSAVPRGSNVITPTLDTSDKGTHFQPVETTGDEPQKKTDVFSIINNIYKK